MTRAERSAALLRRQAAAAYAAGDDARYVLLTRQAERLDRFVAHQAAVAAVTGRPAR